MRSRLRSLATLLFVLAAPLACTSHTAPADSEPGEFWPRYADAGFKLRQDVKVDATGTGLVVGESHIDLSGLLDVAAIGGEFTVSRRVTELRHVDVSGALVPKALAGKPELDTAAVLALTTMQIVDMFGVVDEEASAALPDAGAADDVITASLGLPELPPVPLTLGVPVTTRRQDVEQFGPDEIELTIETTHTLVRIDHQDGRRLAEITSVAQATASRDVTRGKVSLILSVSKASTLTVVFDLDARLPVRSSTTSNDTLSLGSYGDMTFQFTALASYTPS